MPGQRFNGVGAATGIEATAGWKQGTDRHAIQPDGQQQYPGERAWPVAGGRLGVVITHPAVTFFVTSVLARGVRCHARAHAGSPAAVPRSSLDSPSLRSARSRSFPSSALDADAAGGSARTTNVVPRGNVPNLAATRCRRRRRTRCRTTAFPTALLTTKPARTGAPSEQAAGSRVRTCATSLRRPDRAPLRMTSRKSSLRRNRADAGNKPASLPRDSGGQLRAALTAAGGQNAPARARAHPEPEPVLTGTTTVVRLEGALTHGSVSRFLMVH